MKSTLALAFFGALSAGAQGRPEVTVGVYHWGGTAAVSMSQGVERIAELGARAARVTLSPRYYTDYNTGAGCYPEFSLAALARVPDVRDALGNSKVPTIMLTVYDGVTFGDCAVQRFVDPAFYTPANRAAIIREYSDFTFQLFETYRGTGKRFIVSNWESDNTVYCGAAYSYAVDQAFRQLCDAAYAQAYRNGGPGETIEGLRLWFEARETGIADGRNRAQALGFGGVEVLHVPEISMVRALRAAGLKSVLYDLLPSLGFEQVSYSSYESLHQTEPGSALAADLDEIRAVSGARQVIVGEFGFARTEGDVAGPTETAIAAAGAAGVSLMFYWQLFDQDASQFGLYDRGGALTPAGETLGRILSASMTPVPRQAPSPRRPGAR